MKKIIPIFMGIIISLTLNASNEKTENVNVREKIAEEIAKEFDIEINSQKKDGDKKGEKSTFFETGVASFYGGRWNGRRTASGEIFNTSKLTAAHKTLPFGSKVKVTNLSNGKYVVVRINDRGPFIKGRVIDLSYAAFSVIESVNKGITKVKLEILK